MTVGSLFHFIERGSAQQLPLVEDAAPTGIEGGERHQHVIEEGRTSEQNAARNVGIDLADGVGIHLGQQVGQRHTLLADVDVVASEFEFTLTSRLHDCLAHHRGQLFTHAFDVVKDIVAELVHVEHQHQGDEMPLIVGNFQSVGTHRTTSARQGGRTFAAETSNEGITNAEDAILQTGGDVVRQRLRGVVAFKEQEGLLNSEDNSVKLLVTATALLAESIGPDTQHRDDLLELFIEHFHGRFDQATFAHTRVLGAQTIQHPRQGAEIDFTQLAELRAEALHSALVLGTHVIAGPVDLVDQVVETLGDDGIVLAIFQKFPQTAGRYEERTVDAVFTRPLGLGDDGGGLGNLAQIGHAGNESLIFADINPIPRIFCIIRTRAGNVFVAMATTGSIKRALALA